MTRAEAIARLLSQPDDATVFMVCITPGQIADRLASEYPQSAARHSRDVIISEAANAIEDYVAACYPSSDDEVGIGNDIVSNTADALVRGRTSTKSRNR